MPLINAVTFHNFHYHIIRAIVRFMRSGSIVYGLPTLILTLTCIVASVLTSLPHSIQCLFMSLVLTTQYVSIGCIRVYCCAVQDYLLRGSDCLLCDRSSVIIALRES